jgi:DNA (cytosine-5)-methyltransferase 1
MMQQPTLGSLFAGIGGIDLGFERAGFKTLWQVEIDPYCRKVLQRHFPDAERFEDVRNVGAGCLQRVDVIAGGFPCQDVSLCGLAAGLDGERSGLWFEMLRIIRTLRPHFVLVENVAALLERGMGRVLAGLAECGYDAEWDCLPASYFGAPHERKRLWIIAYSNTRNGATRLGPEPDGQTTIFAGSDCPSFPIWLQTPESFIGVDDGLRRELYRDAVSALGNAVVPQIPELIAQRIHAALTA